eukprot:GILK01010178.1.p1 GENE.GILK01010178.1~~GILK01010178.1.p1  ORF type:complete len:115 (-),score=24.51 GILK01010178.1:181-525(-)
MASNDADASAEPNKFVNDGSFMEMFLRMQAEKQSQTNQQEVKPPKAQPEAPVSSIMKEMKAVEKKRKLVDEPITEDNEEEDDTRKAKRQEYLETIKTLADKNCRDPSGRRPLVK